MSPKITLKSILRKKLFIWNQWVEYFAALTILDGDWQRLTHLLLDNMAAILADDIFRCIFVNENICILNKISLKFVPKGPIGNKPAMV